MENEVDNLVFGVFDHFLTREVGIGFAGTGIEQTEEIIDFGDGSDRRTRILVGGFLLDADDRTQTGDFVDIGTVEIIKKITGVG